MIKAVLKQSVWFYDLVGWLAVLLFFGITAFINDKSVLMAFIGAIGVIVLMFIVGLSVEIIIETIKHIGGIGTVTGLLTNFPEALVVIVGLVNGNILFANSTPLGSNFVNPIVMVFAGLIAGNLIGVLRVHSIYLTITLFFTCLFAGLFFWLPIGDYDFWLLGLAFITGILFFWRPDETDEEEDSEPLSVHWFLPATVVLIGAGYCLDPMVNFASEASAVSKGLIGFTVLSVLSSWPEFKSIFSLISRNKVSAALLNTLVSNIINLWLAGAGVLLYWLFQ